MGLYCCGFNPTTEEGKCFGNSWRGWEPLVTYLDDVVPEISRKMGRGLNAQGAIALADRLQTEINSGRALAYGKRYTGTHEASIPFYIEDVQMFVAFLRGCGGFFVDE